MNRHESPIITSSSDTLDGTPVFVRTRVPVKNLTDYLEAGDSLQEFLNDFPSVSHEQAVAFLHECSKYERGEPPQEGDYVGGHGNAP